MVLPLLLHSVPVWPGGPWWWFGPCVPTFRQVRGNKQQMMRKGLWEVHEENVEGCLRVLHARGFFLPPLSRSGPNRLHCLGPLRERLTIWGAMDSIPAPSSVQGHNLTEDTRDPENWQNMGDYSEGDAVSQPQMTLEEVRPETAGSWDKVGQKPEAQGAKCPCHFPCQVPDSPASNQGHSLPGSSREHMAHWQVRYLGQGETNLGIPGIIFIESPP